MTRCLSVFVLIVLSVPALAQNASDIRVMDETLRTPTEHLALADGTTLEIRGVVDDLRTWTGLAMFESNDERLGCLTGMERRGTALLGAAERAARDLRPVVLNGAHAQAEREARHLRIALHRAQKLRAAGLECSHLVTQPIEPPPRTAFLAPIDEDLFVSSVDLMDLMSAQPGW